MTVPLDAHIDAGVREVVELLNRIRGITTRASCQGLGPGCQHHRHSYWAYVLFRHPLPLRLREYLIAEIDTLGRVEDDGIYSRWQERNGEFLTSLLAAVRAYAAQDATRQRTFIRWRLAKLRACLARPLSGGQGIRLRLCLQCRDLVFDDHLPAHRQIQLLQCQPGCQATWFAEFASLPRNRLEPDLIESDGWESLIFRTQRGDFGPAFQRRWLRFRARKLADLATRQLRRGTEGARQQRIDLDCFYGDTHLTLDWQLTEDASPPTNQRPSSLSGLAASSDPTGSGPAEPTPTAGPSTDAASTRCCMSPAALPR